MKALDTSALLALLEGDRSTRDLLRRLRGVEWATTEANLLELAYVAQGGPQRIRARRRELVDRLRRKLTVLPIDARAVGEAGRLIAKGHGDDPPLTLAMMAALEADGCDELFTLDPELARGRWKLRVTRLARKDTKK